MGWNKRLMADKLVQDKKRTNNLQYFLRVADFALKRRYTFSSTAATEGSSLEQRFSTGPYGP